MDRRARPEETTHCLPETTLGAAGQTIHRRELLERSIVGFLVACVGGHVAGAQVGVPPRGDRPGNPTCGYYNGGFIVPDARCGTGASTSDASCGKLVQQGDWGGPVAQDFDCGIGGAEDSDCTKLANASGYHSDSLCSTATSDASCGLPYDEGATMQDHDCQGGSVEDCDCGLPSIGGGKWKDGDVGHQ